MSVVASQAVLAMRTGDLSIAERFVLLVYALHARQPDDPTAPLEAWPTAPTVAAETGLSREHVQRCLKALQERGLLRQTGAKRGRANVYQVSLRRITMLRRQITATSDVTSPDSVISRHTEEEVELEGEQEAPVVPVADPDFDAFWAAYPRKIAKGAARRAWAKARKRATPEAIMAGLSRYAADPSRTPTYTAHPATWLNGDRWEDEGPAGSGNSTGKVMRPEQTHFRNGGAW